MFKFMLSLVISSVIVNPTTQQVQITVPAQTVNLPYGTQVDTSPSLATSSMKIYMDVDGVHTVAEIPATYSPSTPSRVAVYVHGMNGLADKIWNNEYMKPVTTALVNAGYIVIASDFKQQNNWGNTQSSIDMKNLLDAYKKRFNLEEKPYMIMQSMGGMATLNAIAQGKVNPKAVVGLFPACNLAVSYPFYQYTDAINASYGITVDNPYSIAAKGHDPIHDIDPAIYQSIPFKIWASSDDHYVPKIDNTDAFRDRINGIGGNVTVVSSTGDHGDPSNYQPTDIVNFFNAH